MFDVSVTENEYTAKIKETNNVLPPFPEGFDFLPFLRAIHSTIKFTSTVQNKIQALESLRRLFKFQKKLFLVLFDNLFSKIFLFLKSENTAQVETTMILFIELLYADIMDLCIQNYLEYLIPKFLEISVKKNYKPSVLASIGLKAIEKHLFYYFPNITIEKLVEGLNSEPLVANKAAEILYSVLVGLDEITRIELVPWEVIFTEVIRMYLAQKGNPGIGLKLINELKNAVGEENWNNILAKLSFQTIEDYSFCDISLDKQRIKQLKKQRELNNE